MSRNALSTYCKSTIDRARLKLWLIALLVFSGVAEWLEYSSIMFIIGFTITTFCYTELIWVYGKLKTNPMIISIPAFYIITYLSLAIIGIRSIQHVVYGGSNIITDTGITCLGVGIVVSGMIKGLGIYLTKNRGDIFLWLMIILCVGVIISGLLCNEVRQVQAVTYYITVCIMLFDNFEVSLGV